VRWAFILVMTLILGSCSHLPGQELDQLQYRELTVEPKPPLPIDFISHSFKVVSVGDSLTQGVGDSTNRGGYVPYLKEYLEKEKGIKEAEIVNYGVKGNRASQLISKLKTTEVKNSIQTADMVLITIGGNDVMKVVKENFSTLELEVFETEKKKYEKNLRTIIDSIREVNPISTVVLIGLYNPFYEWFPDVEEMDMIMQDWNMTSRTILTDYEQAYFVDIADIFRESEENLLYSDYFHPNDLGYEKIAVRIYETLQLGILTERYELKSTARKEATSDE
jgi:lysophospholipase L1-like esterase